MTATLVSDRAGRDHPPPVVPVADGYRREAAEVAALLDVMTGRGLRGAGAAARLAVFGANELAEPASRPLHRLRHRSHPSRRQTAAANSHRA
jgi:Cation transporter/ATPase, N-terminus